MHDSIDFYTVLSSLSSNFLSVSLSDIDVRVKYGLAEVGKAVRAERVSIFQFADYSRRVLKNTYEWSTSGLSPQLDELSEIRADTLPWWSRLERLESVVLPDKTAEMPEDAESIFFTQRRANSLAVAPITNGESVHGFLAAESSKGVSHWTDKSKALMMALSGLMSNVFQRIEAETALDTRSGSMKKHLQPTPEELGSRQKKLMQQERQHLLTVMAAGIVHDFNNSLSPVQWSIDLLRRDRELRQNDDELMNYLSYIEGAAEKAAETVRGMRKLYNSHYSEKRGWLDMNKVIEDVVNLTKPYWKYEAETAGKTITVTTALEATGKVRGYEGELYELLTNLIFNAVDAMPEGGEINLSTTSKNATIFVEISDNGVGMSPEIREKCFQAFYTTKGEKGSGLGLAALQEIVKRHKGYCSVDSAQGKGTTFRIVLPCTNNVVCEDKGIEQRGWIPPLKILLVEDNEVQRSLMWDLLTHHNHTVDVAGNGLEGVSIFKETCYDVIITDRVMPEMNGDDFIAAVKAITSDIPVIMLTGLADIMKVDGFNNELVNYLLPKPVTEDMLLSTLEKIFFE